MSDGLTGSIDELRIYNRSLEPEEVRAYAHIPPVRASVWARALPPTLSNSLVLHWGFNEPGGQVERDLSGNGNHGARGSVPGLYGKFFPNLFQETTGALYFPIEPPAFVTSTAPAHGGDESWLLASPSVPVKVLFEMDGSPPLRLETVPDTGELRHGT
eukprot:9235129-Pyramimonas_sp.AAC.1